MRSRGRAARLASVTLCELLDGRRRPSRRRAPARSRGRGSCRTAPPSPGSTCLATSTGPPSRRAASAAASGESMPRTTPPRAALVRRAVELDDDRAAELVGDARGLLGRGGSAPRRERHAEALEDERRLVLGERAAASPGGRDTSGTSRRLGDGRDGPHGARRFASASIASRGPRRSGTSSSRASSWNAPRRVGAVDGRHRAEDARVRSRSARERAQRQLAPLVVRRVAELRQVGLRDEDVERARLGHELERARVDELALVCDAPRVERVSGREVVRERGAQARRELGRERLERDPGRLRLVGEQRALAARLGDRRRCASRAASRLGRGSRASRRARGSPRPRPRRSAGAPPRTPASSRRARRCARAPRAPPPRSGRP